MIDTNLIPKPLQFARFRRRRIKGWTLIILAAGLVLCIPLIFEQYLQAEVSRLRLQDDQMKKRLAGQRVKLATLTVEVDQSLLQLNRAQALRAKRAWSAMYRLIAEHIPDGCWLSSIATDPASPSGVKARPSRSSASGKSDVVPATIDAPRALRIEGFASDPGEPHHFIANLKLSGVFTGVSLETSRREQVGAEWFFRFKLLCEW